MNQYRQTHLSPSAPTRLFALGPAATRVAVLAFFAMLLLLYLAQSTQGATRQYDVRTLEEQVTTLKQDQEQLELESIRLQSLKAVAPPTPPADQEPTPSSPTLEPASQINALPLSHTIVSRE